MPKHLTNPAAHKILNDACRDFPHLPSQTLAKRLLSLHPLVFGTLEDARSGVRYRRGATGKKNRRKQNPEFAAPPTPYDRNNPLGLPPSAEIDVKPYELTGVSRVAILGDIHLPYHDMAALTCALQWAKAKEPDCILLNGDTVDFHSISHFQKDPEARDFDKECEAALRFFAALRKLFPEQRIIYKMGNHDERYDSYMIQHAPAIFTKKTLAKFNLASLFELDSFGIEVVGRKSEINIGKLAVLHGHELPKGMQSSVNPARGAFLRTIDTCAVSHFHRTSKHTERTLGNKLIGCWSIGCLCGLRPLFDPNNKWNHGAAFMEVLNDKGDFNFDNATIHRGEVL